MNEEQDSSAAKDPVRMKFLKAVTSEIQTNQTELVQNMFETKTNNWSKSLKVGDIFPLHKKGIETMVTTIEELRNPCCSRSKDN